MTTYSCRTEGDIAAEKDIASKLKKAYKLAKVMASKKREKERYRIGGDILLKPLLTVVPIVVLYLVHYRERAAAAAKHAQGTNLDLSALVEENPEELAEFSEDEYDEDEEEYVEVGTAWRVFVCTVR